MRHLFGRFFDGVMAFFGMMLGFAAVVALVVGGVWFWSSRQPTGTPASDVVTRDVDRARAEGRERQKREVRDRRESGARRSGRRPTAEPAFPPLAEAVFAFEPIEKRLYAADGDAHVPPHTEDHDTDDFSTYGFAFSHHRPTGSDVSFIYRVRNVSGRDVVGLLGKLTLRDRTGRALFVERFNVPGRATGGKGTAYIPEDRVFYGGLSVKRNDTAPCGYDLLRGEWDKRRAPAAGTPYHTMLHADPGDLTLEWTPYFVAYKDGTMAGDMHAAGHIDGEGLPVRAYANFIPWLVHLQYPEEYPNATLDTVAY